MIELSMDGNEAGCRPFSFLFLPLENINKKHFSFLLNITNSPVKKGARGRYNIDNSFSRVV